MPSVTNEILSLLIVSVTSLEPLLAVTSLSDLPSKLVIVNVALANSLLFVISILLIVTFITSSFIVAELVTVPSSDTVNSTTSLLIV